MYEDDRQLALSMYADMFDMAANEQELLQKLLNPTRQAVLVARAYNSKARGLVTDKSSSEETDVSSDNIPAFVIAINQLREEIFAPEIEEEPEVYEFPETITPLSSFDEDPLGTILELERSEEEAVDEDDDIVETEDTIPSAVEESSDTTEDNAVPPEAEASEEIPSEPSENSEDEIIVPEQDSVPSANETDNITVNEVPITTVQTIEEIFASVDSDSPVKTIRKPKVFLLILYILFAIPVTVAGIAVLLIPTLICLGIAAISIFAGVAVLSAAFTSFSVIADLLVIVGLAVVLLAVGLLFLWTFLWFVVGAIIGLIRGVIELGGKWCYKNKEVSVNG